jgi:hypothetical protein
MFPFSERPDDERQLVRYLLGQLPEEEAERIDESSIADDDVAWRLRAVEDDLVDAYVTGNLDGDTRERFEAHYLASPKRREKVRFAAGLLGAVDRAVASEDGGAGRQAAPEARESARAASRGWTISRATASWRFVAVAALVLVGCAALLLQGARLRRGLNQARTESAELTRRMTDLERQLQNQRAANVDVAAELDRTRSALEAAARLPAGRGANPADRRSPSLAPIAVVLFPQTRTAGPVATLAAPRGVDRVRLELRLESKDFPRYRVGLRDPATNQIVWRSAEITARASDNASFVPVAIPGTLLKPQHYALELTGIDAIAPDEVVGSYAFQIIR